MVINFDGRLIMSKEEEFIREHTRNCSNVSKGYHSKGLSMPSYCVPWLTPNQARKAVEIAREEMIERACDAYCKVCGHYAHKTPTYICRQACDYYKDFKQAMKDE